MRQHSPGFGSGRGQRCEGRRAGLLARRRLDVEAAHGGRNEVAAAVPIMTWTSLYDALQSFAKAGLVAYFRGLLHRSAGIGASWPRTARSSAATSRGSRSSRASARSGTTSKIRTPVFMIQGRRDCALRHGARAQRVRPAERTEAALSRRDLGHTPAANPPAEQAYYLTQARLWFDRFLRAAERDRHAASLRAGSIRGQVERRSTRPSRRGAVLRLRWRSAKTIDGNGKVVRTSEPTRRINETFRTPLAAIRVSSTTRWPHLVAVLSALTPRGERS